MAPCGWRAGRCPHHLPCQCLWPPCSVGLPPPLGVPDKPTAAGRAPSERRPPSQPRGNVETEAQGGGLSFIGHGQGWGAGVCSRLPDGPPAPAGG